ncbi:MAG TPA: SdrD B-like domain-containing protein, partial [Pirellulaceae bacterium]|nr:SdrD B-like domain-containing protein [Pirellulaceae bacterium]
MASVVDSELRVDFITTGTTTEVGILRSDGATITLNTSYGGAWQETSFSSSAITRIVVSDVGGGTNQLLSLEGTAAILLSGGFASDGVERFETADTYDYYTGTTRGPSLVTSGSGAISISAPRGIVVRGFTSLITEDGGITLAANSAGTDATIYAGTTIFGTVETVGTGHISISGRGSVASVGVLIDGGVIRSTSATNAPTEGTITIQGTGGSASNSNRGVVIQAHLSSLGVFSNSGNISIIGQSGNPGIQNDGVNIFGNGPGRIFAANQASISIVGTAAGDGHGVVINSGVGQGAGIQIETQQGDIHIQGFGGPAGSGSNSGVSIAANERTSVTSATGAIYIEGDGRLGRNGVAIGNGLGPPAVTSVSGPITVQGTAGSAAGSVAILVTNSSFGTAIFASALNFIGDSFSFTGNGFISAASVSFAPLTPGTPISLGGGDILTGAKRLGLANFELNRIFAGTFIIGNAASGSVSVDALIDPTPPQNTRVSHHVEIASGGDIVFNAEFRTVSPFNPFDPSAVPSRGNLLLSPGPTGSVQPKSSSTDIATRMNAGDPFNTSFTPGSDLRFNIAGLTADTQYDRLTAFGGVNLAGADLALTGGFVSSTGNVFTIVSATSVTGIFNGLPDGSHVIFNGRVLRVNYSATTVTLSDIGPAPSIDLAGRVFDDRDNDGLFNGNDEGVADVAVQLFDESNLAVPLATVFTAADGTYLFDADLSVGSYRIVAGQPTGLLDGKEKAGSLGGTVDNATDSQSIQGIVVGFDSGIAVAVGYNFAELHPSRVQGLVWEDANNNGEVDFGEQAIEGASIRLTGTDDRGAAVDLIMQTDSQGLFEFLDLRPSDSSGYTLTETQPQGFVDGLDVVGTVNGVVTGTSAINDVISQIAITQPGSDAINYNFAELPAVSGGLQAGRTAGIGFWQNKNGQALIKSLNGGPN